MVSEANITPNGSDDRPKVIIYDPHGKQVKDCLCGLIRYLWDKYQVRVITGGMISGIRNRPCFPSRERWHEELTGCVHVFMKNGDWPGCKRLKDVCEEAGVEWSVFEVGWFPQKDYWHLDSEGTNANSSLMRDDLSWVGPPQYAKLKLLRKKYKKGFTRKPRGYVLVPLQVESDTNIRLHSPFKRMQDFVRHCEKKFAGKPVVFKIHPKDPKVRLTGSGRNYIAHRESFVTLAQEASLVYGINSTCLLEAALLGIPVEAVGEGLLKAHAGNKEKLLAALADKQIPNGESDLDYWVQPILSGV